MASGNISSIDGGSDDGTTELVAEYADRISFCRVDRLTSEAAPMRHEMQAGSRPAAHYNPTCLIPTICCWIQLAMPRFYRRGTGRWAKGLITIHRLLRRPDRQLKKAYGS